MKTFATYDLSRLSLFFLDDNQFMRKVVQTMCNAVGIQRFEQADTVDKACQVLSTYHADIVITDWQLGPPDGLDFVRYLRTDKASPNPYVPIIMLTGHGDQDRVLKARDAGVNLFMAKPVSAKGLCQRLTWIIDNPLRFIHTEDFFGPDRRRKDVGPGAGNQERRQDKLIRRA